MSVVENMDVLGQEPAVGQRLVYLVNGAFVAVAPAYVYHAVMGLPIDQYPLVYGAVIVVVALLLSLAYHSTAFNTFQKLMRDRAGYITKKAAGGGDIKALKLQQAQTTRHEAVSGALMYVNAAFVLGYLAAAILFAKSQPISNFILSTVLPAALIFYLSSLRASMKK
eukprot:TRINITY_DN147_c0_g1_i1.p1 TRINITY_DN147_c0_g1~~TRINITY_DN147_c0_g1_i1.p1  ORF type:complete len:167 (+),score=76.76 TRINITY_DN147_c0_g1_i1:42-542(+)